jgi:hypothetical protein
VRHNTQKKKKKKEMNGIRIVVRERGLKFLKETMLFVKSKQINFFLLSNLKEN